MAVTIRDVARLAGVSPSTASRAFTLSGPVDPETHARIGLGNEAFQLDQKSARSGPSGD